MPKINILTPRRLLHFVNRNSFELLEIGHHFWKTTLFLSKYVSTFVSFLWRHYNPYCHNVQPFWHAYCSHRSCLLGTIQDFLCELDINFSLYHVIVRPTKIINHLGIAIYVLVGLTMTWYSEKNYDFLWLHPWFHAQVA